MTIHSFFLDNLSLIPGMEHVLLEKEYPEWFHQVTKVLRMKAGKRAYLLDMQGKRYEVEFKEFGKKEIKIACIQEEKKVAEPSLTLYTPLIKLAHLEVLIDMATQLGVTHFQFFDSDFTEREALIRVGSQLAAEAYPKAKQERLKRIIREACEQSERFFLPTIDFAAAPFEEMIKEDNQVYVAIERTAPRSPTAYCAPTSIIIGPEGGWSPREKEIFEKNPRFIPLDLHCNTILRAETAAVIAIGLLRSML